jgi:hypothetical protein
MLHLSAALAIAAQPPAAATHPEEGLGASSLDWHGGRHLGAVMFRAHSVGIWRTGTVELGQYGQAL